MKKILVAEDNDSNYVLMTYILKRDYQFVRTVNGQETIDRVDEGDIDLVLMDIKMPVMDGIEATRIIRDRHPALPIIALTANVFESDRKLAFEAGCNEFLSKSLSVVLNVWRRLPALSANSLNLHVSVSPRNA